MLRVLRLYLKAAIFKPELPRTRGESNPRPRDCESRRASHETTSKGHFASNKNARRHSESSSTRTIPAERRARLAEIVKSPQFLNLDHANLRKGSRAHVRNRKKSQFLNLDHANLRRGSRAACRNRKKPQFLNLDHANLRRGSRAHVKNRKKPQFLNLDHANLRRGSRAACRNRKKSSVFEPRPRESPQRVARAPQKS